MLRFVLIIFGINRRLKFIVRSAMPYNMKVWGERHNDTNTFKWFSFIISKIIYSEYFSSLKLNFGVNYKKHLLGELRNSNRESYHILWSNWYYFARSFSWRHENGLAGKRWKETGTRAYVNKICLGNVK